MSPPMACVTVMREVRLMCANGSTLNRVDVERKITCSLVKFGVSLGYIAQAGVDAPNLIIYRSYWQIKFLPREGGGRRSLVSPLFVE